MNDRLDENRIKTILSWLKYNECFLDKARQKEIPVFERVNFISRFTDNLNSFLSDTSDVLGESAIRTYIEKLYRKRDAIFNLLSANLRDEGIIHQRLRDASEGLKSYIHNLFYGKISQEINVKIIDSNGDLAYIKNNQNYVAIALRIESFEEPKYLIAEIPESGEIVYTKSKGVEYILIEDIVLAHVSSLVVPYEVDEAVIISLTRDKRRKPVKIDVSGDLSNKFKLFLSEKIKISQDRIFKTLSGNSFEYMNELVCLFTEEMSEHLTFREPLPVNIYGNQAEYLNFISKNDILSITPFESPEFPLELLEESVHDENVIEIRLTVINSVMDARVIRALNTALDNGKNLRILAEIKTGVLAERLIPTLLSLETCGAEISYSGADKLLNFEVMQIFYRDKDSELRAVTYFSALPIYHEKIRQMNICFASSRTELAVSLARYFEDIVSDDTSYSYGDNIIAGSSFEKSLITLIREEEDKGTDGRIFIKTENITNSSICKHLIDSSKKGVRIRIINSGANSILPASRGETDNIEIISIAGSYFDSTAIYIFGSGRDEKVYISSADLDSRSLDKNNELAIKMDDRKIINRIKRMLSYYLKDKFNCQKLDSHGNYHHIMDENATSDVYEALSDEANLLPESFAHFLQM